MQIVDSFIALDRKVSAMKKKYKSRRVAQRITDSWMIQEGHCNIAIEYLHSLFSSSHCDLDMVINDFFVYL